jgi:hypothetical protein
MNILKSRIDEQHYWDGLVLQLKSTTISRVYKAFTHTHFDLISTQDKTWS